MPFCKIVISDLQRYNFFIFELCYVGAVFFWPPPHKHIKINKKEDKKSLINRMLSLLHRISLFEGSPRVGAAEYVLGGCFKSTS